MRKYKTGRLTNEEQAYIENNVGAMTLEQIAKKLKRKELTVKRYADKLNGQEEEKKDTFSVRGRPYWEDIKNQFSQEELRLFEYHWNQIIKQFNKDVIHTEELQIVDVIKHEILCSRVLRKQQESEEMSARLQATLNTLRTAGSVSDEDNERMFGLERQISTLNASIESMTKEFKTYQDQKQKLFDKIKGSRDQRVSKFEDTKQTFASLVMRIRKDPEFANKCSADMEKMRLSMAKHLKELGDYMKYSDSQIDRPILNETTVFIEEDEE